MLSSLPSKQSSVKTAPNAPFNPASNANVRRLAWENWASTARCIPAYFHQPRTEDEIKQVIAFARERKEKIRVVGYGHSPGSIALTNEHMIALGPHFNRVLHVDAASQRATVQSGISLEALNEQLDEHGLALPMLGSISDQTIGGSLACATHGSATGVHAVIAAYVTELHLIDANGQEWICNAEQNKDLFDAARVSLGALGVITRVTLQCESAFDLHETTLSLSFSRDILNPQTFNRLLHHPEADFVRMWWIPHTDTIIYTRMQKVRGVDRVRIRDSERRRQAAQASSVARQLQRVREWKDRAVGFHMLQFLYYLSTFGKADRTLVPRIAQLYTRLIFPPPSGPLSPAAWSNAAATAASASSPSSTPSSLPPSPFPSSSYSAPSSHPSPAGWVRQDRHDRILNFDCLFKQYVTEWAIDQDRTVEALKAIKRYIEQQKLVVHFPIEIRFGGGGKSKDNTPSSSSSSSSTVGDGIWLSPCYSSPQTWIGIIMYRPYGKDVAYRDYFRGFERLMSDAASRDATTHTHAASRTETNFHGKPHWAKNVVMPLHEINLPQRYPRLKDFAQLRRNMDPNDMFANPFIHNIMQTVEGTMGASDTTNSAQSMSSNPPIPSKL